MDESIKLLNENELSDLIDRGVQTLRNERFKGKGIPYVKIGRSVRYRVSDIKEYLKKNLVTTQE